MRPLGLRDLALTAGMFLILGALAWNFEQRAAHEIVSTVRVIDGDTIDSRDGRIRLVGIDAPELDQTCDNGVAIYDCGREARERLRQLVGGQEITCATRRKDRYGRFLATCHAGDVNLAARMVETGWAVASGDYDIAEMRARTARRGIWAGDFERPREWRSTRGMASEDGGLFDPVLDRLRLWVDRW
ncbi:MAG: thermonuclease family protein [Rhizobiaceae bacterium]|nr:thermonuclease family protein [Rhizobiaceae bacterium]